MDVALNEVKEIQTLIFNNNTMHNSTISNSINTLVSHYDIEAKMSDINATKYEKINFVKAKLKTMKIESLIKDDKVFLVKGRNFKINQGLVKIVENKYAPNVEYISQLLDAKLQPLFSKLSLYMSVTSGTVKPLPCHDLLKYLKQ